MPTLDDLRAEIPQYKDLPDDAILQDVGKRIGTNADDAATWLDYKPSSLFKAVPQGLATGVAFGGPKMLAQAARAVPSLSDNETLKNVEDWATRNDAKYAPSMTGRGMAGRALVGGAQGIGSALPLLAADMVAPEIGIPASAALFGGSGYTEAKDSALKQGLSEDQANQIGLKVGGLSGLVGGATGGINAMFLRGVNAFGKGLGKYSEDAVSGALQKVRDPAYLGDLGKNLLAHTVGNAMLMGAQGAGTAAIENDAGMPYQDPLSSGLESAASGAAMSFLMSPVSALQHRGSANQRSQVGDILTNPTAPLDARMKAADITRDLITPHVGADHANAWHQSYTEAITQDNDARHAPKQLLETANEIAPSNDADVEYPRQGGLLGPGVNPYDLGGHVTASQEGRTTTLDAPTGDLFGQNLTPSTYTPEGQKPTAPSAPTTAPIQQLERDALANKLGGAALHVDSSGQPTKGQYLNGKLVFTDSQHNTAAIDPFIEAERAKSDVQHAAESTWIQSGIATGSEQKGRVTIKKAESKTAPFLEGANTLADVAERVRAATLHEATKGKNGAESQNTQRLALWYKLLTGKDIDLTKEVQGENDGKSTANPDAQSISAGTENAQGSAVVPRSGEPGGESVRQDSQQADSQQPGQVAVPVTDGQPGSITSPDQVRSSLTAKQKPVFDYMVKAITEHRLGDILGADGTWQYQKIANDLGMERGSAKSFIDQTAKRIAASQGRTVDEVKAALKARTAGQRTTEASDYDKLGLSPAEQTSQVDHAALEEGGGMNTIGSLGGSQGAVEKSEHPPGYVDSVVPSEKAVQHAEIETQRLLTEALSHPEASHARVDWDDMKGDKIPPFHELPAREQAGWIHEYAAAVEAGAEFKSLEAMQRNYERQLDLRDEQEPTLNQVDQPRVQGLDGETRPALTSPESRQGSEPPAREPAPAGGDKPANAIESRVADLRSRLADKPNELKRLDRYVNDYRDTGDLDTLNRKLEETEQRAEPTEGESTPVKLNVFGLPVGVTFGPKNEKVAAKELKIGDWVIEDGKPMRVVAIEASPDGKITLSLEHQFGRGDFDVSPHRIFERKVLVEPQQANAKYSEALDHNEAKWNKTVDDYIAGRTDRTKPVDIMDSTPASIQVLGVPDLPIKATAHLLDAMHNHSITEEQLRGILKAVADPLLSYIHSGRDGELSFNIVTRATNGDGFLTLALQPNRDIRSGKVNYLATVVARNQGAINSQLRRGGAMYVGDLKGVPGAKEAIDFGKKNNGRESSELKAVMAKRYNLPDLPRRVMYQSDRVKLIDEGKAKFSNGGATTPTTREAITTSLKDAFFSPARMNQVVTIHDTVEDARADKAGAQALSQAKDPNKVQAFVGADGKVHLIAENIEQGHELGVMLHEIGVHVGMEKLVGKENMKWLANKVEEWAARNDDSVECRIAKEALDRAGTSSSADRAEEKIAYMVEGLVREGIHPQAAGVTEGHRWFRKLWAAAKVALRQLGFKNPDKFDGQHLVDMAYGAAHLELDGAWHGTAADFRRFNHEYMGSGEGAQAFGWGTYVAQRLGIAKDYWKQDVARKSRDSYQQSYTKDGKTISHNDMLKEYFKPGRIIRSYGGYDKVVSFNPKGEYSWSVTVIESDKDGNVEPNARYRTHATQPDAANVAKVLENTGWSKGAAGSLHRTAHNVRDHEFLDWDKPLKEQSQHVQDALRSARIADTNDAAEYRSGADIYRQLSRAEDQLEDAGFDPADRDKAASEYLDSIGIKGIKFLDQPSRSTTYNNGTKVVSGTMGVGANKGKTYWQAFYTAKDGTIMNPVSGNVHYDEAAAKAEAEKAERDLDSPTHNLVIFNDKNIVRAMTEVGASRDRIKFSEAADRNIDKLPKPLQSSAHTFNDTVQHFAGSALRNFSFLHDLVDQVKHLIPSVEKWQEAMHQRDALKRNLQDRTENILHDWSNLTRAEVGSAGKAGTVAKFIEDATRKQLWYKQPEWRTDKVAIDDALKNRYNALSPNAQKVVDAVFQHGNDILKQKLDALNGEITGADLDKTEAGKLLKQAHAKLSQLQGPYAPLKRFGDYVVVTDSPKYRDSTPAEQRKLETDEAHHRVDFYDTKAEALAAVREEQRLSPDHKVEAFPKEAWAKAYSEAPFATLQRIKHLAEAEFEGKDKTKAQAAVERAIQDLYLSTITEYAARKTELHRRNIAGNVDMIKAFASQGHADAHFIAQIGHGNEVYQHLQAMKLEAKDGTAGDRMARTEALNTIIKHHVANISPSTTSNFVRKAMQLTSFWQLATSPAHYLQGLTQPMMMTLPMLEGRYGATKSWGTMLQAYRDIAKVVSGKHILGSDAVDITKHVSRVGDEVAMLQALKDHGLLDVGPAADMGWMDANHAVKETFASAQHRLNVMNRNLWSTNGLAAGVAAYRLAHEFHTKGGATAEQAHALATKYAIDINRTSQGDWTRVGEPLAFKNLPRLITQFRKFAMVQFAYFARMAVDSLHGATPTERLIARKSLGWSLAHHAVMAGSLGLPGAALAKWAIGMIFSGDEEPADGDKILRDAIGDKDLATLLLEGVPAAAGLNMSQWLGAGEANPVGLIGANTKMDISSRKGVEGSLLSLSGPFIGGLLPKWADGFAAMHQGDYYKGVEKFLPTGLGNALQGYRVATEGFTNKKGDELISPDEITLGTGIALALGMKVTQLTERQRLDSMKYDFESHFKDETQRIQHEFNMAYKDGDSGDMAKFREQFMDLQAVRQANGFTREPLSALIKSAQSQRNRERSAIDGVETTKKDRRFVANAAAL